MADSIDEIKKLSKANNLIIGTKNTLKKLKIGSVEKVWLSSNCPPKFSDDISKYCDISKVKLEKLDITNSDLGVICKKQYAVSVVSVLKGE